MTVIIGFIVVAICVFGGFAVSGGNLFLLIEPWAEFVIIAGAAAGGLIVKSPPRVLKLMMAKIKNAFSGGGVKAGVYNDALHLIHDIAKMTRQGGLLALEPHLDSVDTSTLFAPYSSILKNPALSAFIVDNLRLVVVGSIGINELEAIMEEDIEAFEEENSQPQAILSNTADALPGLGIVAAVLGIIKTMASVAEGPEVVGEKVAAALVGTFLGVLLAYGFVGPLATNVEMGNQEEMRLLQLLKTGILAISRGTNPKVAAEFARRSMYLGQRPGFEELEHSLG